MRTLTSLSDLTGVEVLDHLDHEATIPVLAGLQAQGDLIVIPFGMADVGADAVVPHRVPPAGVELVRGQHAHVLVADGTVDYTTMEDRQNLAVAVVEVAEGATAYLLHTEHGAAGIAPGRYIVRRQREQAEQQRLIVD